MSPIRMSRIEGTVRIVLEFVEGINRSDIAGMMKLVSDDCVYENSDDEIFKGKEAITEYWEEFLTKNPGTQIKGEEVFGLGFRTIMQWRTKLQDQKEQIRGVDIFHVNDGLISKQYSYVKRKGVETET